MEQAFSRTEMLLGKAAMEKLAASRVAVFGIGGVGGYVCEALVRSGIGAFDLVDSDVVSLSNLNRQIIALRSTLGRYKTEVMKERMLDINPAADVRVHNCFFLPENRDAFPFDTYDYVVDAVDTVAAKLALAEAAREYGVPLISSMGAGNKLDGSAVRDSDILETRPDPLSRVMRRELKKRGIERLKVVWSEEPPMIPRREETPEEQPGGSGRTPGSVAFAPSVAGLILAGEVIRDLTAELRSGRREIDG